MSLNNVIQNKTVLYTTVNQRHGSKFSQTLNREWFRVFRVLLLGDVLVPIGPRMNAIIFDVSLVIPSVETDFVYLESVDNVIHRPEGMELRTRAFLGKQS